MPDAEKVSHVLEIDAGRKKINSFTLRLLIPKCWQEVYDMNPEKLGNKGVVACLNEKPQKKEKNHKKTCQDN